MLSKLKNKFKTMASIGIAILVCIFLTGATLKLPTLPKTEKILWTGYWDTGEWKDKGPYEYYCVVSEKDYERTMRVYKPTPKGYKKIYTYSDGFYFLKAYPDTFDCLSSLHTYWAAASLYYYRVFECDPNTDKIKMTFQTGYRTEPERFNIKNGDSYLIIGDEGSFFSINDNTLSFQTAIFYRRVPGNGYSKFTTCKWDDRYLMMDTISKATTIDK